MQRSVAQNFRARIPEVEADLAENKHACDEARAVLKQDPTVLPPLPPPPDLEEAIEREHEAAVSEKPVAKPATWQPQWNRPAFSKFRDLQNIPKEWGVGRLVLIWRGEDQQELRVIAPSEDTASKAVNLLLSQQLFEVLPPLSGNRWNFKITREQYRQIGEEV